jgi:GAF domain-containing protein
MFANLRQRLFTVHYNYPDPLTRLRARGLLVVIWMIIFAAIPLGIIGIFNGQTALDNFNQTGQATEFISFAYGLLSSSIWLLLAGLAWGFLQRGNYDTAAWLVVLYHLIAITPFFLAGLFFSAADGTFFFAIIVAFTIPPVSAGALLGRRSILIAVALCMLLLIIASVVQSRQVDVVNFFPNQQVIPNAVIVAGLLITIVGYMLYFVGNNRTLLLESLSETEQIEQIRQFSARVSEYQDEQTVMNAALDTLRLNLHYNFGQIYLLDEKNELTVRSSTTMGAQQSDYGFTINDSSIVSAAYRNQRAELASLSDLVALRTHFLAATRYGLSVPITAGQNQMGVLDVQANTANPFNASARRVLALFGTQIANALVAVRQINNLRNDLETQQSIVSTLRTQLVRRDDRARQAISQAWDQYMQRRGQSVAYGYDALHSDEALEAAEGIPDHLRTTLTSGTMELKRDAHGQIVSVPIRLGEETLGAMSFTLPPDSGNLSQRQIEMVNTISQRLAMALENTRLLEQTQAQANREKKASELGDTLIRANDMNTLLKLAADNFSSALGAIYTRIYIQPNNILSEQETYLGE